jgi:alanyl-tRNA synthetase
MPLSAAPAAPETLTFDATVREGGREVVLSETYFYPEGGGQPPDRGTLGGLEVLDVQQRDGEVVHVLSGDLEAGATVEGAVDPEFRRYCMRAHTASHVLYGAGRRLLDDLGYGGFGITDSKVRVDLATPTSIDDATIVELERLVNQCVYDARTVSWEGRPRGEALDDPEVAFNAKTEEGLSGETVRVVEVDGWDVAACGGTHVSNTIEIGPVTVLGRSNPGEGLTRVEFAVGAAGIERRATEKEAVLAAADALDTNAESLAGSVEAVVDEREGLERQRDALEAALLSARVESFRESAFERDGATWVTGVVDADVDALTDRVESRPDGVDVLVLCTPDGKLAVGADGGVDAAAVVEELTDRFGGGGGGSPAVAQAGGLSADGETVVASLEEA